MRSLWPFKYPRISRGTAENPDDDHNLVVLSAAEPPPFSAATLPELRGRAESFYKLG
jgi:hypothetical protein